jgi:methyl-accepting chemotaxis protein
MRKAFDELEILYDARDRGRLNLFITNDFSELIAPYFDALQARSGQQQASAERSFREAQETNRLFLFGGLAISIIGALIASLLVVIIYRSIAQPINKIVDTVHRVAEGDFDVRTRVAGDDELGELGQAFDQLLQDRVAALSEVQHENEVLNNSIIALLQAVFQLSQRDLTVKVPVTEDVTGPLADALNLLTDETSKVLLEVTRISEGVAVASDTVKSQSDKVIALAVIEREEVEKTAVELRDAAEAMNHIAELAQACNMAADNAIKTTQTALETVTNTVNGINNTRDTIRETEKRIKRLGERSQEISGIVNIINAIAERTHILALNASMHAASAGEAGRGFAVVANEVQRLAENAREATSQIATLVSNIQTETSDTVNTMNAAITQVVEGSRLAEQAGEQMKHTQMTTADLVASVQQIAVSSQEQAKISNELLQRAAQIQQSTQQTSQELQQQNIQTDSLVRYARGLVESVRVFTLPPPNTHTSSNTQQAAA